MRITPARALLSLGELQDPPEPCVLVAGKLRRRYPALSSNRPTASRPRHAETRIRAAPTTGAPTPRGQPHAAQAACAGSAVARGCGQVVRLLPPTSADLRCQDDEALRARAGQFIQFRVAPLFAPRRAVDSSRRGRLRAPVCPQRRNQGHIAAECLAAPKRAIYDEVESAPVI